MRAVRGFTPLTPCVFNNQLIFFCRILRWWTVFRWSTLIWIDLRKYGNLNCVFTSLPFIHCYGDNGGLKSYKPTREGTDKPWELVMRRSSCRLSWTWTKILDSTEWEHLKPESVEGEKINKGNFVHDARDPGEQRCSPRQVRLMECARGLRSVTPVPGRWGQDHSWGSLASRCSQVSQI